MGVSHERARKPGSRRRKPGRGTFALARGVISSLLVVVALCAASVVAVAQSSSGGGLGSLLQGLSPDLQQKLQGVMGGSGASQASQPPQQPTVLMAAPGPQGTLPPSKLELIMSSQLGQEVSQFGYNQVGIGAPVMVPQTGAVQDTYVLGPGDTLDISLRGQESNDITVTVDRNGQVTLPKLAPIPAAGRTLGEFRRDLVDAVRRGYLATQAFATVDQLRQVSVLVAGEVANPGVRILTASSTPLDAILLSGGVSKTGSLRNIKLIRDNRIVDIDLYSVLMQQGRSALQNLRDGDRILVPPVGATVAIAGSVDRSGIFELPPGRKTITERELMEYAGGLIVPGAYTSSVLRLMDDGTRHFVDISNEPGAIIRAGEAVAVRSAVNISLNRVMLVGAVRTPGAFALGRYRTLHDLLPSADALLPGAYTLLGVVERTDPKTLEHEAIPFSPVHVIAGTENLDLVSDDKVHILTESGMQCLVQVIAVVAPISSQMAGQAILSSSLPGGSLAASPTPGNLTAALPSQDLTRGGVVNAAAAPACGYPIQLPGGQQIGGSQNTNNPAAASMQPSTGGAVATPMMGVPSATPAAGNYMSTASMIAALNGASSANGSAQGLGSAVPLAGSQLYSGNSLPGQGLMGQNSIGQGQQTTNGLPSPTVPSNSSLPGTTTPFVPGYPGATLPGAAAPSYASPTTPYTGNGGTNASINPFGFQNGVASTIPQDLGGFTTDDALFLARALSQYQATITGAVQEPGVLMVAPNTTLAEALVGTHGFDVDTDLSSFEVTSVNINNLGGYARTQRKRYRGTKDDFASITMRPFDTVIFHHIYADRAAAFVSIEGEVKYPGQYNIMRGEHLSTLLARAGGLTDEAYPYGTVFLRQSVAQQEQKSFKREAEDIRSQMFDALIRPQRATSTQTPPSPEAFEALSNMLGQIEAQPALGRVAYIADPVILRAHPERDPMLEPGDSIVVPKRPSSVSVLGEVMEPGTVPYNPNMSVDDYIDRVGGTSQFANASGTIIILPDGTAHRVGDSSWLSFGHDNVPPGSVVMVPRDLTSLRVEDLIVDSTQIFAQLATMTAALSLLAQYK